MDAVVAEAITGATGIPFQTAESRAQGGGCIAEARIVHGEDGRQFFVKLRRPDGRDLFGAEAFSLRMLAEVRAIRVPGVVCAGEAEGVSYLVLEALALGGRGSGAEMGRRLAALHRHTGEAFGWEQDNFIGDTPQPNAACADWVDFYREQRLAFQFRLARRNGLRVRGADALMSKLDAFFESYTPAPSLLHGDLWGGNASFLADGTPVIFDPASYYGDREADIAFTHMFGGFGPDFHHAYAEAWPLDGGFSARKRLYNLYHELNHYNLFGGGYGTQAQSTVDWLLRQL